MMFLTWFMTNVALANPKPAGSIGFGACIGAPSGLTGKIYMAEGLAAQFSVGGDLGQIGDVGVSVDLVQHLPSLNNPVDGYAMSLYLGGGGTSSSSVTSNGTKTFIGLRGVMGLLLTADGLPVEVYIETAPSIYVIADDLPLSWGVDGQLGFRYYF